MAAWTTAEIPDLTGRTAVVTGANAGLGFQIALALTQRGAHTVLACRSRDRGRRALERVQAAVPGASSEVASLDLASLSSIRQFADDFRARHDGLDILVNNAGVVMIPRRETTADGFERQFGTNHLGHFALTRMLLPSLLTRPAARVVTMSSMEVRWARLALDDLQSERKYGADRAYAQSKLANLVFALELQRRLAAAGTNVLSCAAHPGWARTDQPQGRVLSALTRLFAQPAAGGALPALYAATMPDVAGGEFFAPGRSGFGLGRARRQPRPITPVAKARNPETTRRLWAASEELTAVSYAVLAEAKTGDTAER